MLQNIYLSLQAFFRDNFKLWSGNGSCVEGMWNYFKDIILEGTKHFIPQTFLSKNWNREYYNEDEYG